MSGIQLHRDPWSIRTKIGEDLIIRKGTAMISKIVDTDHAVTKSCVKRN